MIERSCEIVEIPGGGFAALMPLPDVTDRHWVAVDQRSEVLHARGKVHLKSMARRIASKPWDEGWKTLGMREVVVTTQDEDYDLGGGD